MPVADEPLGAPVPKAARSTQEQFLELAPFLAAADSPAERRRASRDFDARIAPLLNGGEAAALPQIHCFYEVLSDTAQHRSLAAATASMRAAGHPVQVWSYSPAKLAFLRPYGVELRPADDVVPKGLFQRIVAGAEIRYFSDVFRYAVLYEHGGLWMDTDVVLLRPFAFTNENSGLYRCSVTGKGSVVTETERRPLEGRIVRRPNELEAIWPVLKSKAEGSVKAR